MESNVLLIGQGGIAFDVNPQQLMLRCDGCGAKNRVARSRMQDRPVCGRCRQPLNTDTVFERPVEVSDANFATAVLAHPGPVLTACWAPWCAPCRVVLPTLDRLASRYAGQVKITRLNLDRNPLTAQRYHVLSTPTLLLFNRGKLVNTLVGALPEAEIERHLGYLIR